MAYFQAFDRGGGVFATRESVVNAILTIWARVSLRDEKHPLRAVHADSAQGVYLATRNGNRVGIPAEQVLEAPSVELAPEPSRPVDLTHLARQTFGQRDLEQEVLRLFLNHSSIHLARLKGASDQAGQRAAAHFIKGSARGIGAWQVATAADIVERFPDPEGDAIRTLSAAVEEARAFIVTLLDD